MNVVAVIFHVMSAGLLAFALILFAKLSMHAKFCRRILLANSPEARVVADDPILYLKRLARVLDICVSGFEKIPPGYVSRPVRIREDFLLKLFAVYRINLIKLNFQGNEIQSIDIQVSRQSGKQLGAVDDERAIFGSKIPLTVFEDESENIR